MPYFSPLVIASLTLFAILGHISCLNISQISVESVVFAPEAVKLSCDRDPDADNDVLEFLEWHKLVDNQWKLVKRFPMPSTGIAIHSISPLIHTIGTDFSRIFNHFHAFNAINK